MFEWRAFNDPQSAVLGIDNLSRIDEIRGAVEGLANAAETLGTPPDQVRARLNSLTERLPEAQQAYDQDRLLENLGELRQGLGLPPLLTPQQYNLQWQFQLDNPIVTQPPRTDFQAPGGPLP